MNREQERWKQSDLPKLAFVDSATSQLSLPDAAKSIRQYAWAMRLVI